MPFRPGICVLPVEIIDGRLRVAAKSFYEVLFLAAFETADLAESRGFCIKFFAKFGS